MTRSNNAHQGRVDPQSNGLGISSTQVSRASRLLDEELERWRATDGSRRQRLVERSGSALARFFAALQARGLSGVRLLVSDDHVGLKAAREARFPGVAWQRCQFHLQQNAGYYVLRLEMRREAAGDLRAIFESGDQREAERRLQQAVDKYAQRAPKLSAWMEANVAESFTVFSFPETHRRRLRTSNLMKRISKELNRRTRVATLFPNEASLLRLVSAVSREISEA